VNVPNVDEIVIDWSSQLVLPNQPGTSPANPLFLTLATYNNHFLIQVDFIVQEIVDIVCALLL
jgi:hypothetical protein